MMVIASTAAVYDISDEPCRETDIPRPLDIYGISKYTCEWLGQLYAAQTGAPCIAARIFNAVGPNETNPHLVPELLNQLIRGHSTVSLGNLEPYRDYIDTRDLAGALICALDHEQDGFDVFNMGTGEEHSVKEIVQICENILGRQIEIKQSPDRIRKVDRMHLCANIDKIREATGWQPKVEIKETLKELLEAGVEYTLYEV